MAMEDRLDALIRKHKFQHDIVEALEAERAPDDAISTAKLKKLRLKDEIERIKKGLQNA